MNRALVFLLPVFFCLAFAVDEPIVALHYRVIRVDRVERTFTGAGQSRPVVGVFSTVYRTHGRAITAGEFWGRLSPGDEVDAKVRLKDVFSVAVAGNLNIDR